jgi:hypothetical protein
MKRRHSARSRLPQVGSVLAAAFVAIWPVGGSAAGLEEYQVKAAFLYNFARMVDWPAHLATVNLCILGQGAFGQDLNLLAGRSVGEAKLQIRHVGPDSASGCQLLFIPASEDGQMARALDAVRSRPVLTVAETGGAAERGAVLNFYLEQNKVRFEVNLDAARRTGLPISSQLLKLARLTHDRS